MTDVVGAFRSWANNLTDVVGPGQPLALGFQDSRLRSPGRGCYGHVEAERGDGGLDAEGLTSRWLLTVTVYSATDDNAAAVAADAVLRVLDRLSLFKPPIATGGRLLMAASPTTRISPPGDGEPSITVNADVYAG